MSKENFIDAAGDVSLEQMQLPEDLAGLSIAECKLLCEKIRELLINTVTTTGGHLASNLGVVELTLALHRQFHSPDDRIVWDVGHQAYVHKILTGRYAQFASIRQEGGLAGFPKPSESPHDAFVTGHSSTAVSAACGIAEAFRIQGSPNYAVAVVGDGAATGGMFFEGLNNGGKTRSNLIVILNDNECAISKNVGAVAKYLADMRSSKGYVQTKWAVERALGRTPVIGKPIAGVLKNTKDKLRQNIEQTTMFEDLGFVYLGPIDGHDIEELDEALAVAKSYHRPVLVHVRTVKGKGYAPAEANPGEYHGIPRIDVESKNPEISTDECYSTVFGRELVRLAKEDKRICAVTAAMKYGTGLQFFGAAYPQRFFDVGIAEQHAVTFSGGLAAQGMIPVFAVYSTFLQRSYDQLLHDISIAGLHMVLGVDRAGIVGEDGETHQGVFDVPMLTAIPHICVYSPATYEELVLCLRKAVQEDKGLSAVRYPRGHAPKYTLGTKANTNFTHIQGEKSLLVTYGRITAEVGKAAETLRADGISCGVLQLTTIWPLDHAVLDIAKEYENVYFFEESDEVGGIGEKLAGMLLESGFRGNYRHNAVHGFVHHASVDRCLEKVGLTAAKIVEFVKEQDNG